MLRTRTKPAHPGECLIDGRSRPMAAILIRWASFYLVIQRWVARHRYVGEPLIGTVQMAPA